MGGGKELYESNIQQEKLNKELDTISFYVYFPNKGNLLLFDLDKLYKKLTKTISKRLQDYGLFSKEIQVEGGGGGFETILEILKSFWENKDILTFIMSIGNFIKNVHSLWVRRNIDNLKPYIDIHFFIEADCEVNKIKPSELNYIISRRLANLLVVSSGVLDNLQASFGGFCFTVSVEAKVNSKHFSAFFALPSNRTSYKINRLLQVISNLRIRECLHSVYKTIYLNVICRSDTKLIRTKNSIDAKNTKINYLIISSNLLSDYLNR